MNLEETKRYALRRLESELPANLFYHAITHTRDEVVVAAERLAALEGIQDEALFLLLTAAWLHDLGFIEQFADHESVSARIAGEVLPGFGYTAEQIAVVKQAIFATALPQAPVTLLEQILLDADLDTLGREDFPVRSEDLRRELAFLGKEFTSLDWFVSQLNFLETHTYFTASAQKMRNAGKRLNIAYIQRQIAILTQQAL